ncbi:MAG TPA: hypothetical protein VFF24_13715 [Acidimicrobiia bacterium]|nr:hypothetical protein [Acidimicrobiia bacterium]
MVSPASAGSRVLPGVAGPRLVLIDPPSSAPAEESALAATSDTVTKRAGRKGSTTSTAGRSFEYDYVSGPASDGAGSLNWGRGLRALTALGVGGLAGALFVRRRRPLFSF